MKLLKLLGLGILFVGTVDVAWGMEVPRAVDGSGEPALSRRRTEPVPIPLMSLPKAREIYADHAESLTEAKRVNAAYHTYGEDNSYSGLELEIQVLIEAGNFYELSKLSSAKTDLPLIVVTDLDDTLVSTFPLYQEHGMNEIPVGGPLTYNFRSGTKPGEDTVGEPGGLAIRPVVELCSYLQDCGIKLVIVTKRKNTPVMQAAIKTKLELIGIDISEEKLEVIITQDKKEVRAALREKYNVVLYAGDQPGDFPAQDELDFTVPRLMVPNYLYAPDIN